MRDFTAPFELDVGITEKSIRPLDGDIIIEGYAADFESDRQGEVFLPGAFDNACAKATASEIPLLHEHDGKRQLGVIEELRVDERGLWTRARIAKAAAGSWAEDVVGKIKRGMMKGLSVSGRTKVKRTRTGLAIGDIDLWEVSVTPAPVQPGAMFAVAQKSLSSADDRKSEITWAADGWARIKGDFTDEEIAAACEAYFAREFADLEERFARIRGEIPVSRSVA